MEKMAAMEDNKEDGSSTSSVVYEGEDNADEAEGQDQEAQPLLFVDINLGGDEQERIVVFEGDTASQLATEFCDEHNLDEETLEKLKELLEQQMAGILPKIEEDDYNSEENKSL